MLPRILILLFIACSYAYGQSLSRGLSIESAKDELGRPESTMVLGSKEVWIYTDGTRLEFMDGKLFKENDSVLTAQQAGPKPSAQATSASGSLDNISNLLDPQQSQTIGGSNHVIDTERSKTYSDSPYTGALENIGESLVLDDSAENANQTGQQRLVKLLITSGLEFTITLIVISLAFRISGFPCVFWQMLSLSLAVAVASALIDLLLGTDALNPIRAFAGLLVLSLLIRQLTDVREWATAIKIAVICRIVSFALIWVLMIGAAMLFSM